MKYRYEPPQIKINVWDEDDVTTSDRLYVSVEDDGDEWEDIFGLY